MFVLANAEFDFSLRYLVAPGRADPYESVYDSQIGCWQNPAFNAEFVIQVTDDFGILKDAK